MIRKLNNKQLAYVFKYTKTIIQNLLENQKKQDWKKQNDIS